MLVFPYTPCFFKMEGRIPVANLGHFNNFLRLKWSLFWRTHGNTCQLPNLNQEIHIIMKIYCSMGF